MKKYKFYRFGYCRNITIFHIKSVNIRARTEGKSKRFRDTLIPSFCNITYFKLFVQHLFLTNIQFLRKV